MQLACKAVRPSDYADEGGTMWCYTINVWHKHHYIGNTNEHHMYTFTV